jgi:hypothetical protein
MSRSRATIPPRSTSKARRLSQGANGDELLVDFTGTLNFFTGTITATLTFDGTAAGRFQDATGSASLVAQFQPDGTIAVVVEGTIDY